MDKEHNAIIDNHYKAVWMWIALCKFRQAETKLPSLPKDIILLVARILLESPIDLRGSPLCPVYIDDGEGNDWISAREFHFFEGEWHGFLCEICARYISGFCLKHPMKNRNNCLCIYCREEFEQDFDGYIYFQCEACRSKGTYKDYVFSHFILEIEGVDSNSE